MQLAMHANLPRKDNRALVCDLVREPMLQCKQGDLRDSSWKTNTGEKKDPCLPLGKILDRPLVLYTPSYIHGSICILLNATQVLMIKRG